MASSLYTFLKVTPKEQGLSMAGEWVKKTFSVRLNRSCPRCQTMRTVHDDEKGLHQKWFHGHHQKPPPPSSWIGCRDSRMCNLYEIVLCSFIFLFLQWENFYLPWEKFQNGSWGSKNGPEDPILKFRVKREILKGPRAHFYSRVNHFEIFSNGKEKFEH